MLTSRNLSTLATLALVTAGALTATACKKKAASSSAAPAPAAAPTEVAKPVAADPAAVAAPPAAKAAAGSNELAAAFPGWDLPARAAALKGVFGNPSKHEVFAFDGTDKVAVAEDGNDYAFHVAVLTPCSVQLVQNDDPSNVKMLHYDLTAGAVELDRETGGVRQGPLAAFCGGSQVYRLDAKGCQLYDIDDDAPSWKPAKCGFVPNADDGGKPGFEWGDDPSKEADWQITLAGDRIGTSAAPADRFPTFADVAAAKQAVGK